LFIRPLARSFVSSSSPYSFIFSPWILMRTYFGIVSWFRDGEIVLLRMANLSFHHGGGQSF
jgi:hypothetical protein